MNDRDTLQIKTYIIRTDKGEYYCGKTKDIDKRMFEHVHSHKPNWFAFNQRHNFKIVKIIFGDYEKEIKRFGIKKFIEVSLS